MSMSTLITEIRGHVYIWRFEIEDLPKMKYVVAPLVKDDRLDFDWEDAYEICEIFRSLEDTVKDDPWLSE